MTTEVFSTHVPCHFWSGQWRKQSSRYRRGWGEDVCVIPKNDETETAPKAIQVAGLFFASDPFPFTNRSNPKVCHHLSRNEGIAVSFSKR